ncbi:hypothetical protein AVEN_34621-1 [Araneus ventricosus]|uniref:Gustatory receptor n=1 Tax=Araneus ventricosus TaxID=182803 RepID=A0A4Y2B0A6_ARAVE|nr:hypothetical protein AVEN_34621-1 [Araneus ventricosus]
MSIPLDAFTSSKQMTILKRKVRIEELLDNIQSAFSIPIFFIFVVNVLTCATSIGWILHYEWNDLSADIILQVGIFCTNGFCVLIAVLWTAGGIPICLENLKNEFYKKSHQRFVLNRNLDEILIRRELFEKLDFMFTGCNIIPLRRSTLLATVGSLLTYTFLVVKT